MTNHEFEIATQGFLPGFLPTAREATVTFPQEHEEEEIEPDAEVVYVVIKEGLRIHDHDTFYA